MTNDIEYIEPTQEHVGQMVEVRDNEQHAWKAAKLTGILSDDVKFAAKRQGDGYSFGWRFARIPRPLTYAERQAKCGLKVGDHVKFVRKFETGEGGYKLPWLTDMGRFIGRIGRILSLEGEVEGRGGCVGVEGIIYVLPYFVLEKVEDRVATRDDIGKQVYVDGASGDIFTIDVIFGVEGDLWRAVVRSGDKRFVYELSNLRVKE